MMSTYFPYWQRTH